MSDSVSRVAFDPAVVSTAAASARSRSGNGFDTHMQDALQSSDATPSSPGAQQAAAAGTQDATAQDGTWSRAGAATATDASAGNAASGAGPDIANTSGNATGSGRASSSSVKLSGLDSNSSANRSDMAQTDRMQSGDRSQQDPVADNKGGTQDPAAAAAAKAPTRTATAQADTDAVVLDLSGGTTGAAVNNAQPRAATQADAGKTQKKPAPHSTATQPEAKNDPQVATVDGQPQPAMATQTVPDSAGTGHVPNRTGGRDGEAAVAGTGRVAGGGKQDAIRSGGAQADAGAAGTQAADAQNTPTDAPTAAQTPPPSSMLQPTEMPKAADLVATSANAAGDATRPAAASGGGDASPAAQVAAPVVTLMQGANGSSSMAVSLHPKDLGEVRIRLDRDENGGVRVVVAATEPGTLRSLMADQSHLHAALDAAALPSGDRQLSFELAAGNAGAQDAAAGQSGSGGGEQRRDEQQASQQRASSAAWNNNNEDQPATMPAFMTARTATFRAGVNITA